MELNSFLVILSTTYIDMADRGPPTPQPSFVIPLVVPPVPPVQMPGPPAQPPVPPTQPIR